MSFAFSLTQSMSLGFWLRVGLELTAGGPILTEWHPIWVWDPSHGTLFVQGIYNTNLG